MVWMESFSRFFVAFTSFVKKQTTKWFKVNDLTICWLPKLVWTWVMLSNLIATFSLQRKLWLKRKEKKVKTKAGKNHSMTFYKVRRESVTRDRGKICMYREISTPKWTSFSKILQIKPIAILERNPFRSCSFTFEEKSSNDVSRYQRGIRLICFTYLYIALLGWKLIFFYKKIRGESLQMWQNCTHLI